MRVTQRSPPSPRRFCAPRRHHSPKAEAEAQNVPDIPCESVANFFKMPPNLYLRRRHRRRHQLEGARVRVHPQRRDPPVRVRPERHASFARSARASTGSSSRTPSASTQDDNVWVVRRRARTWSSSSTPTAASSMVHRPAARKPVDGLSCRRAGHHAGAASRYSFNRPTDVGWDAAGQHLRHRRLRQLARREVRQERPLHQVGRHARNQPGPAATCRTRWRWTRRATSTSATAATRASRSSTTISNFKAIYDNVGSPWAVCISPGRTSICSCRTRFPTTALVAVSATSPARSTRWSSTARSSASSARPASS